MELPNPARGWHRRHLVRRKPSGKHLRKVCITHRQVSYLAVVFQTAGFHKKSPKIPDLWRLLWAFLAPRRAVARFSGALMLALPSICRAPSTSGWAAQLPQVSPKHLRRASQCKHLFSWCNSFAASGKLCRTWAHWFGDAATTDPSASSPEPGAAIELIWEQRYQTHGRLPHVQPI